MANSIAKLAILLTTDASGVSKGFAQARSQLQQFAGISSGKSMSAGLGGLAVQAGLASVAIGGVVAAWRGLSNITGQAAGLQSNAIAFEVMLGSAEKAKNMLGDLRQFALESPFSTSGLAANTQTLMQFGVEGNKVLPMLRMLGDVSLGDAGKMERLTLAFAQMSAAGKLTGQDLLQMINAGFNPLKEISDETGISMGRLMKMKEDGLILDKHVIGALQRATSEGGRMHGMMERMQGTLQGQWAKFVENLSVTFMPLGELIAETLTNLLTMVNTGLEGLNKLLGRDVGASAKVKQAATDFKKIFADLGDGSKMPDMLELAAKHMTELKNKGDSLTQSLRTPMERFADAANEAKALLDAGAISSETYSRAMAKANEDLRNQLQSARQIQNIQRQVSVAAASRFSASGQSAVFQAQMEIRRLEQVERQQLAEQKELNKLTKEANEMARKAKPPVTLKAVGHI